MDGDGERPGFGTDEWPAQAKAPFKSCFECGASWGTEADWRRACETFAERMSSYQRSDGAVVQVEWPVDYDQPYCTECPHDL